MDELVLMRAVGKSERELERVLTAVEEADLQEALRQPWGRRLLRRIIFELAGLETDPLHPEVNDGMSAALLTYRDGGAMWVGRTLALECTRVDEGLWAQLNIERWNAAAEKARLSEKARAFSQESDG